VSQALSLDWHLVREFEEVREEIEERRRQEG